MKREILFRGKSLCEPFEFVYGGVLVSNDMGEAIIFEEGRLPMIGEEDTGGVELSFTDVFVDIDTIGQLILKWGDASFFVGDKLKFWHCDEPEETQECVLYTNGRIDGDFHGEFSVWSLEWALQSDWEFEVIGNIHE